MKRVSSICLRSIFLKAALFFCLTICLVLKPSGANAQMETLTAGQAESVNEKGKNMPSVKLKLEACSYKTVKLVMPAAGSLVLDCEWDEDLTLTKDSGGEKVIKAPYSNLKKGTYYIQIANIEDYAMTYKIRAWYFKTADMTLKPKVNKIGTGFKDAEGVYGSQYFKIRIEKRGFIGVDITTAGSEKKNPRVYLCKADKTPLNKTSTPVNKNFRERYYFAVEPGTYFIRLKYASAAFKIRYLFYESKDTAAALKMATAPKIAKEGYISTVYTKDSSDKWVRYYKITVSSKDEISVYCSNKNVKADILNSSGKSVCAWRSEGEAVSKMIKAGTYYIKLSYSFKSAYRKATMGEVTRISWGGLYDC